MFCWATRNRSPSPPKKSVSDRRRSQPFFSFLSTAKLVQHWLSSSSKSLIKGPPPSLPSSFLSLSVCETTPPPPSPLVVVVVDCMIVCVRAWESRPPSPSLLPASFSSARLTWSQPFPSDRQDRRTGPELTPERGRTENENGRSAVGPVGPRSLPPSEEEEERTGGGGGEKTVLHPSYSPRGRSLPPIPSVGPFLASRRRRRRRRCHPSLLPLIATHHSSKNPSLTLLPPTQQARNAAGEGGKRKPTTTPPLFPPVRQTSFIRGPPPSPLLSRRRCKHPSLISSPSPCSSPP